MVQQLSIWFKYILVAAVVVGNNPVLSAPPQETKQKVARKRPPSGNQTRTPRTSTKKKRPVRKKPATTKKTQQRKPAATRSQQSKQDPKKRPVRKRPAKRPTVKSRKPEAKASETRKVPPFNPFEYSSEFFDLAEELNSSSRQLARATTYLESPVRQKTVKLNSASMIRSNIQSLESKAISNPNDFRTLRDLGLEYEKINNFNEAKDIYFRLIARDPLNPDFHYYLGMLYRKTGELNKAQDSFEEALALDPQHRATLDILSSLGYNRPRSQVRSENLLKGISAYDPDGPAGRVAAVKTFISQGNYSAAISRADEALKLYPDYSGIKILKGNAYEQLGETEKAKAIYQNVIKADPMNVEGHRALGDLYYSDGKYLYAGLAYSDVVYLDGSSLDARYLQGLSFFKTSEWARAANAWEDLLRIDQNHELTLLYLPQVYYILAVEYNRKGEPALGRTSFNKAFSVNGNTRMWLPGALKVLGAFYRERNMFRESLAAYQEAAELSPNDADAYLGLGITYWKMEEPQLARGAWERSLEISPDNNESRGWMIITKQGS